MQAATAILFEVSSRASSAVFHELVDQLPLGVCSSTRPLQQWVHDFMSECNRTSRTPEWLNSQYRSQQCQMM